MKMTVLEAAEIVLREVREPLHQDEIADRILRRNLVRLRGGTPGRTVASAIYMDIKNKGDKSRFKKVGPCVFRLRRHGDMKMTVLKAAYIVLQESGEPLYKNEIAKRILSRWSGLMSGKTPGATVGSAIYMDIKNNGDASQFEKVAPFTFQLRGSPAVAPVASPAGKPAPAGASLSFTDAAFEILKASGNPMHCRDITQQALKKKLIVTKGKTPAATMDVLLAKDIQLCKKRGVSSRFVKHGLGMFSLSVWEPHALDRKIEDHNQKYQSSPTGGQSSGKPAPARPGLPFKEAAFKILSASRDRKPMHYRDITQQALEKNLIVTGGKTPASTMSAILAEDIRRCERRGVRSRFIRSKRGMFALSRWERHDLDQEIERHNQKVREKLLQSLRQMAPERFEELIAELLGKMGFEPKFPLKDLMGTQKSLSV